MEIPSQPGRWCWESSRSWLRQIPCSVTSCSYLRSKHQDFALSSIKGMIFLSGKKERIFSFFRFPCFWYFLGFLMVCLVILCYFGSLNWQHQLCKNPRSNPDIKTLFFDHSCSQPNGARVPSPAPPLTTVMPKPGAFPQLGPSHAVSDNGWLSHSKPNACILVSSWTHWPSHSKSWCVCSFLFSHFSQLQQLCQHLLQVGWLMLRKCPTAQSLVPHLVV